MLSIVSLNCDDCILICQAMSPQHSHQISQRSYMTYMSQEIALGRCSLNVFAIAIVFVLVLPLSSFFSLSFCWFGEAPLTLLICKIYLNSFCPQMGSRGGGQPSGISHIIPFFQSFYIFIMLCSPREWWMFGW